MASGTANVDAFLATLEERLQTEIKHEVETIKQLPAYRAMGSPTELMPWDRIYLASNVRSTCLPPSAHEYFSIESCMNGLALITKQVFGVTLKVVPTQPGEVWHPHVRKVVATCEKQGELGVIYFDLFSRPNKNSGGAQYTLQTGRSVIAEDGSECAYQNPTVALVCGFPPPGPGGGDEPSLLSMSEVEMLFHEMGHALHSMFARTYAPFLHAPFLHAVSQLFFPPFHL